MESFIFNRLFCIKFLVWGKWWTFDRRAAWFYDLSSLTLNSTESSGTSAKGLYCDKPECSSSYSIMSDNFILSWKFSFLRRASLTLLFYWKTSSFIKFEANCFSSSICYKSCYSCWYLESSFSISFCISFMFFKISSFF